MSVATVTEISATSEQGFEDAIQQAIARANKTLRNIEGAWVKDKNVMIQDGEHHRLQGQPGGHLRAGGPRLG
jgi:flavin-binding protein dodecin